MVEYFIYKWVFGFPPFYFYYLLSSFFYPSENCGEGHKSKFHEKQIEWEKSEHPFVKKLI